MSTMLPMLIERPEPEAQLPALLPSSGDPLRRRFCRPKASRPGRLNRWRRRAVVGRALAWVRSSQWFGCAGASTGRRRYRRRISR